MGLAGARGRGVFWTEGQVRKSISGTGCCGGAGRGQAEASVQLVEMGDEQELGRAERKVWLGGEIGGQ